MSKKARREYFGPAWGEKLGTGSEDEDRPIMRLCPANHFPMDRWAIQQAQMAGYVEVERADFTESDEWDVLLDKDGARWKLTPFLPTGDKGQGVEMWFAADGRWMAYLRPGDWVDAPTQTSPYQAIISTSFKAN